MAVTLLPTSKVCDISSSYGGIRGFWRPRRGFGCAVWRDVFGLSGWGRSRCNGVRGIVGCGVFVWLVVFVGWPIGWGRSRYRLGFWASGFGRSDVGLRS